MKSKVAVAIEAIIFLIVVSRFVKPFQSSSDFNKRQKTAAALNDRSVLRFQPIDATHSLNFSAGE